MSSVEDESAASGAPRRELLEPLRVSVGKSATRLAYRLRYLRAFNGQPWEEAFSARGCRDGGFEDAPTCGWHTDPASGARVADSQGFCCECSAGDALKHTLEGGSDEQSRGNLDCGVFQNGLFWGGTPGSAHCLRWGDAWWAGYALEAPAVDFEIAVRLARDGDFFYSQPVDDFLSFNFFELEGAELTLEVTVVGETFQGSESVTLTLLPAT